MDKIRHSIDAGMGAAKESLGSMFGNEKMRSEGAAEKAAAHAQSSKDNAQNKADNLKQQASDQAETMKNNVQETAENAKNKAFDSVPGGNER